jgi:hypothetical protein
MALEEPMMLILMGLLTSPSEKTFAEDGDRTGG